MVHRYDHVFDVSYVSFLSWPNKHSPTRGRSPEPYGFNSFRIARPKFCFQEGEFRFSKYVTKKRKIVSRKELEPCFRLRMKQRCYSAGGSSQHLNSPEPGVFISVPVFFSTSSCAKTIWEFSKSFVANSTSRHFGKE